MQSFSVWSWTTCSRSASIPVKPIELNLYELASVNVYFKNNNNKTPQVFLIHFKTQNPLKV